MLLQWCKAKVTPTNCNGIHGSIILYVKARFISMIHRKRIEVGSRVATDDIYLKPYGVWFLCMIFFTCAQLFFVKLCLFFLRFSALYKLHWEFQPNLKTDRPSTNAKWQRRLSITRYCADILSLFWPCCNPVPVWKTYRKLCLRMFEESWLGLLN